ncbi:MAG TPA: DUF3352 domain-containing protein [Leptolyngbyaceae cyanobacterium]
MVLAKKPPLLLTAGAALLLIGVGALAYWGLSRRGTLTRNLPVGIRAVPTDAVMAFSLSTSEEEWRRLRQFGTPETQAQFDQFLAKWRDRILTDNSLNFSTDIKPWIGPEVTVAILPDSQAVNTPSEPTPLPLPEDTANALVLLPIADPAKAQSTLGDRIQKSQAGASQDYKGITIQQVEGAEGTPLYAAVLGTEFVVVGNQLATVEQSIDAFKGGKSLVDVPGFNKAFEQLKSDNAFSHFYVNVPSAIQTLADNAQPALSPSTLETFKAPRGLAGALNLEAKGIQLQSISWLHSGTSQSFSQQNGPDQLTQRVPANALLFVSGGNFQQFWQDLKEQHSLATILPIDTENVAVSLQAATGLTPEEDLLPWMKGEFALGILAPPQTNSSPDGTTVPNPALVLMVKASDRKAAGDAFARLDEVMKTRYRFAVKTEELGGAPVTRWTSPFEGLNLSHGWLEGDVAFLTLGTGVETAIAPRPKQSLAQDNLFQLTTGQAPRPNNGHFFVDLKDLSASQNNLLLPPLPENGIVTSKAIEAIGVTATVLGERQVRYDLFVALPRGNRPGALPQASQDEPTNPSSTPGSSPSSTPQSSPSPSPTAE